jgi:hypothetical protein
MAPDEERAFGTRDDNFQIFPLFDVPVYAHATEITTI